MVGFWRVPFLAVYIDLVVGVLGAGLSVVGSSGSWLEFVVVFSPQAITFMTMQPELLDRKNHKNDPLTRPESHVRVEIRKRLQNSTTKHAPRQKSKPNNMFSGNQCCFGSDSISPNLVSGLAGDKYFWPPASIFSLRIEGEGICINIFLENGGGQYLQGGRTLACFCESCWG